MLWERVVRTASMPLHLEASSAVPTNGARKRTGELIARTEASHTHVEWLRFLKQIDRDTPPDLELHLIADN